MIARKSRLLLVLLSMLAASAALASSEDPIMARGFSPETMYQFGNLDSINLFNGNLNVAIPIGQPYSVTAHFGSQLMLSYNSKVWDLSAAAYGQPGFCVSPLGYFYIPNRKSNAGMAWSLGFGRLFPGCHPSNEGQDIAYLTFESPDGASHAFTYSTDGGNTYYTSDSSHLRIRNFQSGVLSLDFPDGTTYTYLKIGCDEMLLSSMTDSDGNTVTVGWDAPHDTQTITDPYGRKTVIHYADAEPNDVYDRVVASVDVPVYSFGTTPPNNAFATYSFTYSYPRLDVPMATAECAQYTFVGPMLTKITRPDLSTFEFEYGYYSRTPEHKGSQLVVMTLPTKGQIQWDYESWELPGPTCEVGAPWSLAVKERKFYDPFNNTTASWKYTSEIDPGPFDNDGNYCPPISYFPLILGEWPKEQKRTTVIDPNLDKSVHYFSVWQGRSQYDGTGDIRISPNGYDYADYGLSMSKFFPAANGAFLSIRQYDCGGTGNCDDAHPDRSTYMLYDHHRPAGFDWVKDPFDVTTQRKRTVYDKDITPSGAAYVEVSSSNFDGYGHYRVVTTSGNFGPGGSVQSRTVTTNYNTVDSEVGLPATHSDIKPGSGTWGVDFTPYASTEKWILGTFTSIVQSESSHSVKQLFYFDRSTGFLKRTRLRRGVPASDGLYTDTGNDTHDLITVYEPTVAVSGLQAAGDVGAETHYGGDNNLLPNSAAALADVNLSSSTGIRSTTTYRYGAASTATIVGAPYPTLNVTVDRNTGFPRSVSDPAGHVTSFEYDNMGRISKQTMPSGTVQDYLYLITDHAYAVSSTHAANNVNPILNSTYTFDAFGRVIDVKDLMADGTYRGRTSTWNVLGQKLSDTAPAVSGTTGVQTTYTYDAFGRPRSIVPPDGSKHATTYQYDGARAMTVTAGQAIPGGATGGIGKSLDGSGNVVEQPTQIAKEEYDSFTRLSKMTEWGKNGAATTGSYTYDLNGHLSGATVTAPEGTQTRSFIYDNRGYLVSQSHPETGTTTFQDYDAFGHAGRRIAGTAGGPFDLTFKYDVYQRLNEIYQGMTLLKKITFDALPAGDPQGSYSQPGQIVKTYRRNDHPELGGDVAVNTYFTYDSAGRLYQKKTSVGGGPLFTQSYGYDEINDVNSLTYPSCNGCTPLAAGGAIPNRTISFNWSHGYLTGIDEGMNHFTSASADKLISYWPNGLLKSITHVAKDNTHEVADSQALDQGMARPSTITFTGVSAPSCVPPSATITAPSSIVAGGSGTASVPATAGASYAWTIQNGTITSGSGSSTITFTAFCGTASVVLNATVTTTCSASSSKTIAVTGGSTATATIFGTQTITQGGTAELWVSLTGTGPWNVTWSDGYVMSNISGITSVPYIVSPTTTTTYSIVSVTDAAGCGTTSGQAVVTVSGSCTPTDPTITAPSSVAAGQTFVVTFNSPANIRGGSFSITNGVFLSSTSTSATVRANCSGNVGLTRSITGGPTTCSSSSTKSVTIIRSSAFVSGSQTISQNGSALISASLSGTAPWTITWSDGVTQSNLTSSLAQRTVFPSTTTSYSVIAVSDGASCSGTSSGTAVVTVLAPPPPTPTALTATRRAGQNVIDMTWSSTAADSYVIQRTHNNGLPTEFTGIFGTSFADNDSQIATNGVVTYVYYVIGVKNGVRSARSLPDIATFTTFTNDPLTQNQTLVAGYHVSELRQAIDAVRRSAGLSVIWGTYAPATGLVSAWTFYEQAPTSPPRDMFNALNQARQQLGMGTIGFAAAPVTGGSIVVTQIDTLRAGVK